MRRRGESWSWTAEKAGTAVVALAVIAALGWSLLFFSFTADDAFISFRNAKNLILHHVWNWNATGPKEEPYTSATYTVLAIVPMALHISLALFTKLVGMACYGALLYRVWTASRSRVAGLLGLALLTLGPVTWVHMYSGLETPLYMLLVVEMALAVARAETTAPAWVYTLFLLLPLTRPEGVVFGAVGVLLYWQARKNFGLPRQMHLFAAAAGLGVAYFAWRAWYFGHPLPNPFYVKVTHQSLRDMLGQLAKDVAAYKGYLWAMGIAGVIARGRTTRVFAATAMVLLLLLFAPHELAMNYADRFYVQLALPVLLIFLLLEDVALHWKAATLAVAMFLLAFSPDDMLLQLKYPGNIARAHEDIGKRLKPYAAGHTLLAADVGMTPYYSDWFTWDYLGLGTNSIARHGLDTAKLAAMHPDLILLYNEHPGTALLTNHSWVGGAGDTGEQIVAYLNKSQAYDYAGSSQSNGFYLVSFLRKDTPEHDAILATLRENAVASQRKVGLKDIVLQRPLPWSND